MSIYTARTHSHGGKASLSKGTQLWSRAVQPGVQMACSSMAHDSRWNDCAGSRHLCFCCNTRSSTPSCVWKMKTAPGAFKQAHQRAARPYFCAGFPLVGHQPGDWLCRACRLAAWAFGARSVDDRYIRGEYLGGHGVLPVLRRPHPSRQLNLAEQSSPNPQRLATAKGLGGPSRKRRFMGLGTKWTDPPWW